MVTAFLEYLSFFLYLYICVFIYWRGVSMQVWKSSQFSGVSSLFPSNGIWDQTQVLSLSDTSLYLLSFLTSSRVSFIYSPKIR